MIFYIKCYNEFTTGDSMIKIYGKNCINEAIRAGHKMDCIYVCDNVKDENFINMARDKGYKVEKISSRDMDKMFPKTNQGYGAIAQDYQYSNLEKEVLKTKNGRKIFLVLDGINDPHNFGAILRSCDAFSIDGVIIPKNRSVGITEVVAKVSTGAIEYVPIIMVNNLAQSLKYLKKNNFWVVGTDASADLLCKDIDKELNIAVIIGSEGFGMSRIVKDECDYMVKIPMTGHVNSLNASVSAGIVLALLK